MCRKKGEEGIMDYEHLAERLLPGDYPDLASFETRYPSRDLPKGAQVTRLAPSPTGFIHLGNLFVAIANERIAHQSGGKFLLFWTKKRHFFACFLAWKGLTRGKGHGIMCPNQR